MSKNAQEWMAQPPVAENDFVSSLIYTDPKLFAEENEKIKKSTCLLYTSDAADQ